MNRKVYSIIVMLLIVVGGMAEPISESEALAIAGRFCNSNSTMQKAPGKNLKLAAATKGYYAFNRGECSGFVIVAADDNAAVEVLGYADDGTFDVDNMPENMKWWLSEYIRQMEYAATHPSAKNIRAQIASDERENIAPLLTCQWDQYAPYNNLCPTIDGKRCVTGCVATAMAQIMYYHGCPETEYNWAAMTDTYSSSSNEESCAAVAQLMYDVGTSVDMKYGLAETGGSGASTVKVPVALSSKFGYDKRATDFNRDCYSISEWEEMIYSNLSNNLPVLYAGQTVPEGYTGSGHAFVCDGYQNGYFHINWGWGGTSNGYFTLTALTPSLQGAGGSNSGYNYQQDAVMNIFKDAGGDYTVNIVCRDDFNVSVNSVTRGTNVTFLGGYWNISACAWNVKFGVKLLNLNNGSEPVYASWIYSPIDLGVSYFLQGWELNTNQFPKTNGEYLVTPVCLVNGNWYDVPINVAKDTGKLIATIDGNSISFRKQSNAVSELAVSAISIVPKEKVFAGKEFHVNAVVTNTGGEYYDNMSAGTTTVGGTTLLTQSAKVLVDVADKANVDFVLNAPNTAGSYDLVILDVNNNIVGRKTINVEEAQTLGITVNSLTMLNTSCVNPMDMHVTASVKCTGAYYVGTAILYIYPYVVGTSVYPEGSLTAYVDIESGETKTIEFTGSFDNCVYGGKYWVGPMFFGNTTFRKNDVVFTLADKIDRDIPESKYASFSASSKTIVPEGVEVYKAKVRGDKVVLNKVETTIIPANTGVILYSEEAGTKSFITTLDPTTADFAENELIPTSVEANATIPATGLYYALKANALEFARLKNGIVLSQNKAYIKAAENGAKALSVAFDDGVATGISTVDPDENTDGAYYTLQGVKVTTPGKGVYIRNGKKVLVK